MCDDSAAHPFRVRCPAPQKNRWIRTRFRLLASVPPIICGILERELGTITDYAGTTGLVIGFSFPALLYLRSRALAERKHFSCSTAYTGYSSYKGLAVFLFSFGIAMLGYVLLHTSGEGDRDSPQKQAVSQALPNVDVFGSDGLAYSSESRRTEQLFSSNFTINYVCRCGGRSLALLHDPHGQVSAFSTADSDGSYGAPVLFPPPLVDPVHCDCAFGNVPRAHVAFFGDADAAHTGIGTVDLQTREYTPLVQGSADNALTHVHAVYAVGNSHLYFPDLGDPWLVPPVAGNIHVFSKSTQTITRVIAGGHPRHLVFPPNQSYFFAVTQPPFGAPSQLQKYACRSTTRQVCAQEATFDLPGSDNDEGGADVFLSAYSLDVVLATTRRHGNGSLCARRVDDLSVVPGKEECLTLHQQPRYSDNLSNNYVGVANQGGRGYELCKVSTSEWGPCVFVALDFEAKWLGEGMSAE